MMTVILVEYHKLKMLRFQLLHSFLGFWGIFVFDEHSPEYWKTCYTIVKANSHIVKPLNFFGAYSAFLLIFFLWL